MIKVSKNEFHLLSFIIKVAVILLSVAVSLCLCFLFEQKGLAFPSAQLRVEVSSTVSQTSNTTSTTNTFFGVNGKELQKLFSAIMPLFVFTRKALVTFFKFFAFFFSGLVLIYKFVTKLLLKKSRNVKIVSKVETSKNFEEELSNLFSYDTIKSLNLTLTI